MKFHIDKARGTTMRDGFADSGIRVGIGLVAAGAALAFGAIVFGSYSDAIAMKLAQGAPSAPTEVGAGGAAFAAAASRHDAAVMALHGDAPLHAAAAAEARGERIEP